MAKSSAIICPSSGSFAHSTFSSSYLVSPQLVLRYVYHLHLVTVILAYFSSNHTAPTNDLTHAHASAIRFDRRIAAISLFMDASANALIAVSPTSSQALFVFLTSLNALTSGGHPALQSLGAVSLRAMGKGNEMGLVFGALGVANAVSHIVAVRLHPMLHPLGPPRSSSCVRLFTAWHIRGNLCRHRRGFPQGDVRRKRHFVVHRSFSPGPHSTKYSSPSSGAREYYPRRGI
jgi:hypothetical protein